MFNLESSLYPNYLFPDHKLENEVHDSNKLSSNNQNSINSIISNIPNSYYSSIPIKEIQSIEINTQKENNSSKPIEETQFLEKNSNSFNSSMLFEMGQFSENPSGSFSSSIPLGIIQTIKVNNPQKEKSTNNNNDSSSNKKKITIRTKKKKHDKFSRDNIKRKIQVHYIKFLRALLNHIIKEILKENIEFKPLDYKFVMKIDKKSFLSIKEKSLGAIFKEHPSPKFKEYKQMNIEVYNKIINKSKKLKNILDKLYLEFINIYYYNIKKIDGRKYGFDKDIDLSNNINIKFYKDLIETNETNSSSDNELYNNKIKNIMQMEFVSKISPVFVYK